MSIQPEPIIYIIIGSILGFTLGLLGEEIRRIRIGKKNEKMRKIQNYRALQSWLFRFQNRWQGFQKITKIGGEDMPAFMNELKWFADRINEALTSFAADISNGIYTDMSDLSNEIWKLGQIRASTQAEFLKTGDELWDKAQAINELIDKEIEKLK